MLLLLECTYSVRATSAPGTDPFGQMGSPLVCCPRHGRNSIRRLSTNDNRRNNRQPIARRRVGKHSGSKFVTKTTIDVNVIEACKMITSGTIGGSSQHIYAPRRFSIACAHSSINRRSFLGERRIARTFPSLPSRCLLRSKSRGTRQSGETAVCSAQAIREVSPPATPLCPRN